MAITENLLLSFMVSQIKALQYNTSVIHNFKHCIRSMVHLYMMLEAYVLLPSIKTTFG